MKTVLIIVLSSDFHPYSKMIETSLNTWDFIKVDGVETLFACGKSDKKDTDKIMYFPVNNGLFDMGHKNLASFQWALENKSFDYVARVNASCYVDKRELIKYVHTLPNNNLIAGTEVMSVHGFSYLWGGTQYVISRDVIQKIVDNKDLWNHRFMEDEAISLLAKNIKIPFSVGYAGSIDKMNGDSWRCISYGGESISFTDFNDLKKLHHHFYRVKHDKDRTVDEFVMKELFKYLK